MDRTIGILNDFQKALEAFEWAKEHNFFNQDVNVGQLAYSFAFSGTESIYAAQVLIAFIDNWNADKEQRSKTPKRVRGINNPDSPAFKKMMDERRSHDNLRKKAFELAGTMELGWWK